MKPLFKPLKPILRPKDLIPDYAHFKNEVFEDLFIYQHLYRSDAFYFLYQADIKESMRVILVDWLILVAIELKLSYATICNTINCLDRYLSLKSVHRSRLQLLGIGCLMISSKCEERYPPSVKTLLLMTNNSFLNRDLLEIERDILFTLDFKVMSINSYILLEILLEESPCFTTALYYLLSSLISPKLIDLSPIQMAGACVYISHKKLKVECSWTRELELLTRLSERDIYQVSIRVLKYTYSVRYPSQSKLISILNVMV